MTFNVVLIPLSDLEIQLNKQDVLGFELTQIIPMNSNMAEIVSSAKVLCIFRPKGVFSRTGGCNMRLVRFEKDGEAVWINPNEVAAVAAQNNGKTRISTLDKKSHIVDEAPDIVADRLVDEK